MREVESGFLTVFSAPPSLTSRSASGRVGDARFVVVSETRDRRRVGDARSERAVGARSSILNVFAHAFG